MNPAAHASAGRTPPLASWWRRNLLRFVIYPAVALILAAYLYPPSRHAVGDFLRMQLARLRFAEPDLAAAADRIEKAAQPPTAPPEARRSSLAPKSPVLEEARIRIHKAARKLELFDGDRLVKSYRIALGAQPEGRKLRQGTSQTPEGNYRICTRVARSKFHLFLGINYPNAADAEAARGEGLISPAEERAHARAEELGETPSWAGPMGGAIGIHGGGAARDWTLGCIAMENKDVEEIWAATARGTPVEILP